ncbi:MAG TPA: glycosyltransferase family 4 protein, partial [Verrucomicrobiae bacterium]|nr:glycosyltransferase family 4 protein [Verrucomicrobiae bacterium]
MKKITNKILFVTPYYPPNIGGVQNYVYNLAHGMSKKDDCKVVVVTSQNTSNKIQIERGKKLTVYRMPTLFKFFNTPINPLWYFHIKEIIKNEKPDIINAHSPVPFMADMAALSSNSTPFILTYHSGPMEKYKYFVDKIINVYERFFLQYTFKKANKIICSSNFVKRTMLKKYKTKSIIIHPAVDTKIFKPSKFKKIPNSVLFIGRKSNYELKGLFYLINAIKQIPEVTLYIVGGKIENHDKNVIFVGEKKTSELIKIIQSSSVLVLPSLAQTESFGMVLIEAMACKTSVIGTHIGGIPEVINNNIDGLLVRSRDSKKLKEAIEKILHNKKFATKLSENGYKKVTNY